MITLDCAYCYTVSRQEQDYGCTFCIQLNLQVYLSHVSFILLLQHRPNARMPVDTVNIIWWIVPFVMDVWNQHALANKHRIRLGIYKCTTKLQLLLVVVVTLPEMAI